MAICMNQLHDNIEPQLIEHVPNNFGSIFKKFTNALLMLFVINISILMISTIKTYLLKFYLAISALMNHYQSNPSIINTVSPKLYWSLFAESSCYLAISISILSIVFYCAIRSFSSEK